MENRNEDEYRHRSDKGWLVNNAKIFNLFSGIQKEISTSDGIFLGFGW